MKKTTLEIPAAWMKTFGKLRHLHRETARINRIIGEEFHQIETEDRE